jgi:putative membrane-bound dehydrogenase-like protein
LLAGLLACLFTCLSASAQPIQLGLKLPPGFEVTQFADDKLANDIYCMTVDPRGRIVVSGRGYIRVLVDDDHDGRADRAIPFADAPKDGAMGLLWEGSTLYVTGDGGLRRFADADGDGRADGPSQLCRAMKTGGEHTAHALRRGPDGWLYVLCGNNAGIDASYAGPRSPVREPVAGCVLRFSPNLKESEIVAHGYRNPYGMDFNADGELFTFDSDNERCVSLPWYEFTRFYHVIPGGHHGWLSPQRAQWWRIPPYSVDVVAPVAVLGRGSPTGVVCYRHHQFPEEYHNGMFLLDWTFGRIHFVSLRRAGSSYQGETKVFAEAVGENGFAPTAIVVHPQTGDLYVSIGGRGTRGAVYRIRYLSPKRQQGTTGLAGASGSGLEWQPGDAEELARGIVSADALQRRRALNRIYRHHTRLPPRLVVDAIAANAGHEDRYICQAVARLIDALSATEPVRLTPKTDREKTTFALAAIRSAAATVLAQSSRLAADSQVAPGIRLANIRLVQLALGDTGAPEVDGTVWEGYTPRNTPTAFDKTTLRHTTALLRSTFPSAHADLDRELARTLAMLSDNDSDVLGKIASRWTASSDPVEDIHYLIVLARLPAARSPAITQQVAGALLALDRKLAVRHLHRDTHWPLRMAELYVELARRDPGLHGAMLAHADFGRPDHALFARALGFDQAKAAAVFLKKAATDPAFSWNADLVQVVAHLPDAQALPVLRKLWGEAGLEAAILPILARAALPVDQPKFVQGLNSTDLPTVRLCLRALHSVRAKDDGAETLALIRALGNLPEREKSLRQSVSKRLQEITQQNFGDNKRNWTDWFGKAYPNLAVRLTNPDGVDVRRWEKRLAAVDWSPGNPVRGRSVFAKASCASCHSGSQALGPDLAGVAGRFSRADLFTSILQPSRDVSPRYRTIVVETTGGRIHQGLVIYEAVDSLILQTGAATTVRLTGAQIAARRPALTSLMPAGLLDGLQDKEIADLYAYLKTLGAKRN